MRSTNPLRIGGADGLGGATVTSAGEIAVQIAPPDRSPIESPDRPEMEVEAKLIASLIQVGCGPDGGDVAQ
jgi:hypothetical protein